MRTRKYWKMSANPPIYKENCRYCCERWHLTEFCPYTKEKDLIIISGNGEALCAYPGQDMQKERIISSCFALHFICNGWVDLMPVAYGNNAIVCRHCGLRVVIPSSIETFGYLREYVQNGLLEYQQMMENYKLRFMEVRKLL